MAKSLTFRNLPDDLVYALKRMALDRRVPVRTLIIEILTQQCLPVTNTSHTRGSTVGEERTP